ncbi:transglutaminase domain-containing protein [Marinifilum fragile]|uniref:transglutaminase domain-containing protein n=1 Tax=Marinifilum fragile TaxID=570161 RepID=UPI002AA83DF7|nr:transglutaminase domain-containing protein [Marinifilum fragile]
MRSYKYILSLVLFFSLASANAQDLSRVDQVLGGYPANFSSTEELALKITRDFSTDLEKVRAAYTWIALHVAYDTKALGKPQKVHFSYRSQEELEAKKKQFRADLALKTLKRRKALCEGYSTLFQNLCRHMNIECEIVSGTARRMISEIGREDLPSSHAWNAVKINGSWQLIDVTWAAGWVDYSKMIFNKEFSSAYFASDPDEFAMKHLPDDKKWLLASKIKDNADFAAQPMPFKAFLGKNIKLIAPQNGIVYIGKSSGLQFLLQNVPPNTEVAYHFKKEKFGQKVQSYSKGDMLGFTIYPNVKGKDELIIYFNEVPALGYQVNVK